MTDVRKCDGPDCEVTARLDPPIRLAAELQSDQFITVTGASKPTETDFHFCTARCLTEWTKERTRANKR
jgi:hypothetical protein